MRSGEGHQPVPQSLANSELEISREKCGRSPAIFCSQPTLSALSPPTRSRPGKTETTTIKIYNDVQYYYNIIHQAVPWPAGIAGRVVVGAARPRPHCPRQNLENLKSAPASRALSRHPRASRGSAGSPADCGQRRLQVFKIFQVSRARNQHPGQVYPGGQAPGPVAQHCRPSVTMPVPQ